MNTLIMIPLLLTVLLLFSVVILVKARKEQQEIEALSVQLKERQELLLDKTIRFEAALHQVKVMNFTAR